MLRTDFVHGVCELSRSPRSSLRAVEFLTQLLFLSLLTTLVISCSVGDFVGAYFNTYYNARRLFSEAEAEILAQQAAKQPPPEFLAPFAIQHAPRTKLTSVIEKCSKLLQYHPQSALVDDALLMVGQAYFYQDENQKAERKFKELIEGYPESELAPRAKLLLAQTYYRMNEKQKAVATAKELVDAAQQRGQDDLVAESSLVLAQIALENREYAQAIESYEVAAEFGRTGDDRAAAYMKAADVYNRTGDYQKAFESYQRAEKESGGYIGEYRSRFGQAQMMVQLGKEEEAIDLLELLRSNMNNRDFYGEIDLELAKVFDRMNDLQAAIEQYEYVDTTYARTEVAARSYYGLGQLYEKKLGLYDSARVAYNKGRNEFPASEVIPLMSRRADYMNRHFSIWSNIRKYDSLRAEILLPIDSAHASVDTSGQDSTSTGRDSSKVEQAKRPPLSLDSLKTLRGMSIVELASLFYSDIGVRDSARFWFEQFLAEHPRSPSAPRALYMLAQTESQDTLYGKAEADSLYKILVERFPDSEFGLEAARFLGRPSAPKKVDGAGVQYARGEKFLDAGDTQSAIDVFREVVKSYPSSPFASKAQYAVGWIFEEIKQRPDSALTNYQALMSKFPQSEYAARIRPKLAEFEAKKKEEEAAARRDSSKSAGSAMKQAPTPAVADTAQAPELHEGPLSPAPRDSAAAGQPGRKRHRE